MIKSMERERGIIKKFIHDSLITVNYKSEIASTNVLKAQSHIMS